MTTPMDLEALVRIMEKHNITHLKTGDVEIQMQPKQTPTIVRDDEKLPADVWNEMYEASGGIPLTINNPE